VTALFIELSSDVGDAQMQRQVYRSTRRITSAWPTCPGAAC